MSPRNPYRSGWAETAIVFIFVTLVVVAVVMVLGPTIQNYIYSAVNQLK